ncbi:MAG: hypothetical protein IH851_13940 [Armatimonadetes bacterium]|nr:hypothetical protein [Armatimonadota bacterium]
MALLAVACGDGGAPPPEMHTATAVTSPQPSPTVEVPAETPDTAFARELADAIERSDANWFSENIAHRFNCAFLAEADCEGDSDQMRPGDISVQRWRSELFLAGPSIFRQVMLEIFSAVDRQAKDTYGGGALQLYAGGEEDVPDRALVVHLLVTGILKEPQPGRWALIFKAREDYSMPNPWVLTDLLLVPPDAVEDALALGHFPWPEPDPATYSASFATFMEELRQAVRDSDTSFFAAHVKARPYTCLDPLELILDVPSCDDRSAGTVVDIVPWSVYCIGCDALGYATVGEVTGWLGRFFATAEGASADDLGPGAVQVENVARRLGRPGFTITVTGIAALDWFGYARPQGRWMATFDVEPEGDVWRIVSLKTAEPAESGWLLPELRGTDVEWTRSLPVD